MHDVLYFTDQFFESHKYPQSHPENENRLINLNKQLKKSHLYTHLIQPSFEKINLDTILLAHQPSLIKKLENNTDIFIDSDTYLGKSSFECAKLASGALKKAIDETINNMITDLTIRSALIKRVIIEKSVVAIVAAPVVT